MLLIKRRDELSQLFASVTWTVWCIAVCINSDIDSYTNIHTYRVCDDLLMERVHCCVHSAMIAKLDATRGHRATQITNMNLDVDCRPTRSVTCHDDV